MSSGKQPQIGRAVKAYADLVDGFLGEESYEVYQKMAADARVSSLYDIRQSLTVGHPQALVGGGNTPVDKTVEKVLAPILPKLIWQLSHCLAWGWQPIELVWQQSDGLLVPVDTHDIPPWTCSYDHDGVLVHHGDRGEQKLTHPYKFLVIRRTGLLASRYGQSLFRAVRTAYLMKEAGLKFWIKATERFGVPSILALFDTEGEDIDEQIKTVAMALTQIQSGSGGALANVRDVKTMAMAGAVKDFEVLANWCNTEISYALTSQSLATGESSKGTYALGEVHKETLSRATHRDARAIAYTVQKVIDWVVEVNFGYQITAPRFTFVLDELAPWARVLEALKAGVPVSTTAVYDRYGIPRPQSEDDTVIANPSHNPTPVSAADGFFLQTQPSHGPGIDSL